jgi:predicted transcriptional regulator
MKFTLPEDFFNNEYYSSLKPSAKLVYSYIDGLQGTENTFSYSELSDKVRIGKSAVTEAIHSLELAGLLKVNRLNSHKFEFVTSEPCILLKVPKEAASDNKKLMDAIMGLISKIAA